MRIVALIGVWALAGCTERALELPCFGACSTSDAAVTVDASVPASDLSTAAPLAFSAADIDKTCGADIGVSTISLADCHRGTLAAELTPPFLLIHLSSNSDKGDYHLGAVCADNQSGLRFEAEYTDASLSAWKVVSGKVTITNFVTEIFLDGHYTIELSDGQAQQTLQGSFDASYCSE